MNNDNLEQRRRLAIKRLGMMAGATALAMGSSLITGCGNNSQNDNSKDKLVVNVGPAAYTNEFPVDDNSAEGKVVEAASSTPDAQKQTSTKPTNKPQKTQVAGRQQSSRQSQQEQKQNQPANSANTGSLYINID